MATTRIDKCKLWVSQKNLDALMIDDPIDVFYLTGLRLSLGKLVITPHSAEIFVDGRYISIAQEKSLCRARLLSELKGTIKDYQAIGFDSSFVTYDDFLKMTHDLECKTLVPFSKPLKALRMIKQEDEILALKNAQKLTKEGIDYIISLLKEGVSEEFLSLEFEFFCKRKGASKLSFDPIIAFGKNSSYPHHRAGKDCLKKNSIVLIDVGAVVDGYAGDMTRCVFFGDADPRLVEDYKIIQEAQAKAMQMVKPGLRFGELDNFVRSELEKKGVGSLFTHGLSHGIGLETHESPRLKIQGGDLDLILEKGMTFTIEPGLYREAFGGVRYEDVVLVTDRGHETL